MPKDADFTNLYFLPTSGGALYEWRSGVWRKVYEERLTESEVHEIREAMGAAAKESDIVDLAGKSYGPRIEDRGAQVSFSALGQEAPLAEKKAWDPDRRKRSALQAALVKRLPGFSVAMGGTTTIDVTKKGVDKAFGIRRLAERLGIDERDTLYIGDELVAGGNDEAVYKTNAQVRTVSAPEETARAIVSIVSY